MTLSPAADGDAVRDRILDTDNDKVKVLDGVVDRVDDFIVADTCSETELLSVCRGGGVIVDADIVESVLVDRDRDVDELCVTLHVDDNSVTVGSVLGDRDRDVDEVSVALHVADNSVTVGSVLGDLDRYAEELSVTLQVADNSVTVGSALKLSVAVVECDDDSLIWVLDSDTLRKGGMVTEVTVAEFGTVMEADFDGGASEHDDDIVLDTLPD